MGSIPRSGRSPGERNGTHSRILTCRIPQTEEPGGLQSMDLQRVRHIWMTQHTHIVTVAVGRYVIQAGENWWKQPSEQRWSGPNTAWAFPSSKQRKVELRLLTIRHMAVLKSYHLLHDGKYKKIIKCKEFLSEQIFSRKLFCAPFQFCKMLIKRLDINSHGAQILVG